jgi:hypothetical protein
MNQTNTVMLAIFIALGAVLVVGLIATPAHAKIFKVCAIDPPDECENQNPHGHAPHGQNK